MAVKKPRRRSRVDGPAANGIKAFPHWESPDGSVLLVNADCCDVLKEMEPGSIDLVCTDPPYGLEFLGKEWDKLAGDWGRKGDTAPWKERPRGGVDPFQKDRPRFHGGTKAQEWFTKMFSAILPACKPGAMLASFGGTRTHHRLTCGIEDAGWEIRDCLMWLFGAGFPKSLDISKAIDEKAFTDWLEEHPDEKAKYREQLKRAKRLEKAEDKAKAIEHVKRKFKRKAGVEREVVGHTQSIQFREQGRDTNYTVHSEDSGYGTSKAFGHGTPITAPATDAAKFWAGYGTGLKPAWEIIVLCQKPLDGNYAMNAIKHGVAGINVDGGRIGTSKNVPASVSKKTPANCYGKYAESGEIQGVGGHDPNLGRWPANLLLQHHELCRRVGVKKVKSQNPEYRNEGKGATRQVTIGPGVRPANTGIGYADADGLEEVEAWDCHPECAVRLLDEQSGESTSGVLDFSKHNDRGVQGTCYGKYGTKRTGYFGGDTGTASRFFKTFPPCRFLYQSKASSSDRGNRPALEFSLFEDRAVEFRNLHPTVKPVELMEYLLTLLYPPSSDAVCLDPFMGSGGTGVAAVRMGRKFIGIEIDEKYFRTARERIERELSKFPS